MQTTHENRGLSVCSSRREFLFKGLSAVLFVGTLVGAQAIALGQDAKRDFTADLPKNFELVRSKFTPCLNDYFTTNINGEEIHFQLIEVADLRENSVAKSALPKIRDEKFSQKVREESFTLLFRASTEIDLRQTTYRLKHGTLGTVELFLVPVGRKDGPWKLYEAVFNRLQQ